MKRFAAHCQCKRRQPNLELGVRNGPARALAARNLREAVKVDISNRNSVGLPMVSPVVTFGSP